MIGHGDTDGPMAIRRARSARRAERAAQQAGGAGAAPPLILFTRPSFSRRNVCSAHLLCPSHPLCPSFPHTGQGPRLDEHRQAQAGPGPGACMRLGSWAHVELAREAAAAALPTMRLLPVWRPQGTSLSSVRAFFAGPSSPSTILYYIARWRYALGLWARRHAARRSSLRCRNIAISPLNKALVMMTGRYCLE
jgi:hypothetical protein